MVYIGLIVKYIGALVGKVDCLRTKKDSKFWVLKVHDDYSSAVDPLINEPTPLSYMILKEH